MGLKNEKLGETSCRRKKISERLFYYTKEVKIMDFIHTKDKRRYSFVDENCLGRECWNPGMYQHRSPLSCGGSRNTGSPDSPCCLNRAYRGCPSGPVGRKENEDGSITDGLPVYIATLAGKRRNEGWRKA